MAEAYYLTKDDVDFLRELRQEHKNRNLSRQTLSQNIIPEAAKETYVAKVPAQGIDALVEDLPSFTLCDIYKVVKVSGMDTLVRAGFQKRIYNLGTSDIGEGFSLVGKDSFGTWYINQAQAVQTEIVRFTIEEVVQTNSIVNATVEGQVCGLAQSTVSGTGTGTGSSTPTMIEVHDALGCFFDEDDEDLIGRGGYAVKMGGNSSGSTGTGSGTGSDSGCVWEVFSLCCPTSALTTGTGTGS
jgi:hypothetical protein